MTFSDAPREHLRTEFGFDMVQVSKNRYTPDSYHDFVGFEVAKPLLERALLKTYGLKLDDALGHVDLAIGTFRRAVSEVIPEMTRVAVRTRHLDRVKDVKNASTRKLLYSLSRNEYEKEWGTSYRRPGLKTRILAFLLGLVPKIGPFKALGFELPTAATEDLYVKSVNATVENYRNLLHEVDTGKALDLPNIDCDTARAPRAGEYAPSDSAYARLLHGYSEHGFEGMRPELRENILAFYAEAKAPLAGKKKVQQVWLRTAAELAALQAFDAAHPAVAEE